MRSRHRAIAASIVFALAAFDAPAQERTPNDGQPTHTAVVARSPDARVFAGPGFGLPILGTVKKGEQLLIYGKDGQYYAVRPSAESRSWVSHLCLEKVDAKAGFPQNVVVAEATDKVYYGSDARNAPSDVKVTGVVERGSLVEVLGEKVNVDGKWYYPITPLAREFRYVSEYDVAELKRYDRQAPRAVVEADPRRWPEANPIRPTGSGGAAVDHPLFAKAEEAERQRNYPEAQRLYEAALKEMKGRNADLTTLLLLENRIAACSAGQGRGGAGREESSSAPPFVPMPRPGQLDPPPTRVGLLTSNTKPSPNANAKRKEDLRSSGVGYLRTSSVMINERPSYAFETGRGQLLFYVTTEPGSDLNLEAYLKKAVDVWGYVQVRADVRGAPHMVVQSVHPAKE